MSWTRIKVGRLLTKPHSVNPAKFPSERFALYSIPAFDQGSPEIVIGSSIGSSKQLLQPGDVLLSKIVPHIRRSWVVGHDAPSQRQIGSGEWLVLRNADIDPRYLSKVLVSDEFHREFMRTVAGVGGSLLRARTAAVAEIEIAIPPTLDEQKRIAAVLDQVDALRRQRQESLQLTERLLQSVFIDMFVKNPVAAEWTSRSVEWMAKGAKGSMRTGPFGSQLLHSEFVDQGIAVLGIDNAVKNRFEWGEPRFITPEKYQDLKRYKVFPDDLIITIMGTLGRCAIVPDDIPEAINTKHLCCITLDRGKCLPEFLHAAFLNHPHVLRQLGVKSKGAVMPGLNMGIIKDLELPMPPMGLQEKFKRFVTATRMYRTDLEESCGVTEQVFGSLQQRAFRGELDLSRLVFDPADDTSPAIMQAEATITPVEPETKARFLQAPPDVEAVLLPLDEIVTKGAAITWSADYFRYRILAAQRPPFSFADVMAKVDDVFEDPLPDEEISRYDKIKEIIFNLLGQAESPALLCQQFDLMEVKEMNAAGQPLTSYSGRKEMLFVPVT